MRSTGGRICIVIVFMIIFVGGIGMVRSHLWKTSTTNAQENYASQPGSYFIEGEDRFVLVDQSIQTIGDTKYTCKVFADKYMLTMYLYTERESGYQGYGSMTQIFYEDGSPMIYDPTEEEWAEWER